MKANNFYSTLSAILFIMFNFVGVACSNSSNDVSPTGTCQKIIINENGDETEYEFDCEGRLINLFGQSTAAYYNTKNLNLTAGEIHINMTEKNIDFKVNKEYANIWILKHLNNNYIIESGSNGFYEENKYFTGELFNHVYNNEGDCISTISELIIGNDTVAHRESKSEFYTTENDPFWGNPFQVFITLGWSAGGHTNKHLTKSEQYNVINRDEEDATFRTEIIGDVQYKYQFDYQHRISTVIIETSETTIITDLEDQRTSKQTKSNKKTITFKY